MFLNQKGLENFSMFLVKIEFDWSFNKELNCEFFADFILLKEVDKDGQKTPRKSK